MDLSQYKAFLFDFDKTLTNSKKDVTPETQRALALLQKRGFFTGLCTGRHYTTLKQNGLSFFGEKDIHVVSGGAQVISTSGKILWENCISFSKVNDLLIEMSPFHLRMYVQIGDKIYGNQRAVDEWRVPVATKDPIHIHAVSEMPKLPVPIVIIHDIDKNIFEKIQNHDGISAKLMQNYQGHFYADITAQGVSKLTGFREWCRMLGVSSEQVIGFGDAENDLEFLENVGYAIAMGNAKENVKSKADEVAASNDENGVAKWIAETLHSQQ